jgi:transcriptional regulator with XRE-family HTH domain
MNDIGEKLREIRKRKGFPQKVIAEHIGVRRSNYSRIEHNMQKLTPEQIALFCEFCDVSSDYILGIKANNKIVYDEMTIDIINRKIKEIQTLLGHIQNKDSSD